MAVTCQELGRGTFCELQAWQLSRGCLQLACHHFRQREQQPPSHAHPAAAGAQPGPQSPLTCAWRPLDRAGCEVPREQASSPGGGAPTAGPPEGPPSSRLARGPFFVDCILICWGFEFIGELLVVWRSCRSQGVGDEAGAAGSDMGSAARALCLRPPGISRPQAWWVLGEVGGRGVTTGAAG